VDDSGLQNGVASMEEPQTMCGAHHSACFKCIDEESLCEMPHQVLGNWSMRLAISREWKNGDWEEWKTSKRGQCLNEHSVGHETRFSRITEKVYISSNFESPETDLHMAANAWWIYYTDTRSLKWDYWLSKCQYTTCSIVQYGSQDMGEFNTGVIILSLLLMRIHPWVVQEF